MNERVVLSKKSWVAYIKNFFIFFMIIMTIPVVISVSRYMSTLEIPYLILIPPFIFFVFIYSIKVMSLKSYTLYYDNDGVWMYCGILPWTKDSRGTKWRDLEAATYFPNFFSWMTRSYTIRISQRYTQNTDIRYCDMRNGRTSAAIINGKHKEFIDNKMLS